MTEPIPDPGTRILIIDDEDATCQLLRRLLAGALLENVRCETDPRQATAAFVQFEPDLILLDLQMPQFDGLTLLKQIRALNSEGTFLPVIVLAGEVTAELKNNALLAGATDFVTKPFDHAELLLRLQNLTALRATHLALTEQNRTLKKRVRERTAKLEAALKKLEDAQKQTIHSERMGALERMARGVAVDFDKSLSVILGHGELVYSKCREEVKNRELTAQMQTILAAARDCVQTVNRLDDFHRPIEKSDIQAPVDVTALVRNAIAFTEPCWKKEALARGVTIRLQTNFHTGLTISGSGGELRNSIANLIFNAVEAMPSGGTINLRTRQENDCAVIEVIDTGIGMTPEAQARCLEPFFTTKSNSAAGLGLSMVYGCMSRHRGTVGLESNIGQGTTARISIPLRLHKKAEPKAPEIPADNGLNILVVDDQMLFCDLIAAYLEQDLHRVEKAQNGREALDKYCAGKFDLVITDRAMPGFNGDQLASAVKELNPDTRVILLTGYTFDRDSSPSPAIDLVLKKPVSPGDLRQAIAQVSANSNPPALAS